MKFLHLKSFFIEKKVYFGNRLRLLSSQIKSTNKKGKKKEVENKYSHTIFLPQTSFDQRANSLKREPEIQKWWEDEHIYKRLNERNNGDKFTLHDGPPYANGDLHIGHSLNKILKDFINKYYVLKGRKVSFIPGWVSLKL